MYLFLIFASVKMIKIVNPILSIVPLEDVCSIWTGFSILPSPQRRQTSLIIYLSVYLLCSTTLFLRTNRLGIPSMKEPDSIWLKDLICEIISYLDPAMYKMMYYTAILRSRYQIAYSTSKLQWYLANSIVISTF